MSIAALFASLARGLLPSRITEPEASCTVMEICGVEADQK